jgi:hypothetical protein
VSFTLAPAFSNRRAISMFPCCAAKSSAVNRFFDRADVRAAIEQQCDDIGVIFRHRPHQRRLAGAVRWL